MMKNKKHSLLSVPHGSSRVDANTIEMEHQEKQLQIVEEPRADVRRAIVWLRPKVGETARIWIDIAAYGVNNCSDDDDNNNNNE
jgi:hypothetical protein